MWFKKEKEEQGKRYQIGKRKLKEGKEQNMKKEKDRACDNEDR